VPKGLKDTRVRNENGLCAQSNNAILIEDPDVADLYLRYWRHLHDDVQPGAQELTVATRQGPVVGFGANHGVQGDEIRKENRLIAGPVALKRRQDGKATVQAYFSPNTTEKTKTGNSSAPIDLDQVYALMEQAEHAVLFLVFYPSKAGKQGIVGKVTALADRRPDLLVQGAISNPDAMPPRSSQAVPAAGAEAVGPKAPAPAMWWPAGDNSRIVIVRATAVTTQIGDLHPELLTAGNAIIHDKIVVIDPLDEKRCVVVTGSHNLGYKASYQNDENLLVARRNQLLAISYAVHVLDTYDHYVFRARLTDERAKEPSARASAVAASEGHGFLKTTTAWQKRWFETTASPSSRDYFLARRASGAGHPS
jgi:phosphatidylserine/phosphatidylglycerophosphate/cardiolipin synthase-like enzyme